MTIVSLGSFCPNDLSNQEAGRQYQQHASVLAVKSVELLEAYRQGREIAQTCPLKKALD